MFRVCGDGLKAGLQKLSESGEMLVLVLLGRMLVVLIVLIEMTVLGMGLAIEALKYGVMVSLGMVLPSPKLL